MMKADAPIMQWQKTPFLRELDPRCLELPKDPLAGPLEIRVDLTKRDVDTGIVLAPNQRVVISADGQLWSGSWFTGTNGPEGWLGYSAGANFPLPYVPPYSLLGRLGNRYFFIGRNRNFVYTHAPARLYLRVNCEMPAEGSWGELLCCVQVYPEGES